MVLQLEGNSDLIMAFEILFVFVRPVILHILSQRKILSTVCTGSSERILQTDFFYRAKTSWTYSMLFEYINV